MSEPKTKPNKESVSQFINGIENERRKSDSKIVLKMYKKLIKDKPKIWGENIVGFGSYHYQYKSGCEGDWMKGGFSPRKSYISIYIMEGFNEHTVLLEQLGKHKKGKSCLNINKLADVDLEVLETLIGRSYEYMTKKYG